MPTSSPVVQIPDFIAVEHCNKLRRIFDEQLQAGRVKPRGTHNTTDTPLSSVITTAPIVCNCGIAPLWLYHVREGLGEQLGAYYGLGNLFPDYTAYSRLTVGGGHELHADSVSLKGGTHHTPWRKVTALIYLSEQGKDFEGGELELPERGLVVRPRPGLLVAMTCGADNAHRVPTVTKGTRDALVFWLSDDPKHRERWEPAPPPPTVSGTSPEHYRKQGQLLEHRKLTSHPGWKSLPPNPALAEASADGKP